MKSLTCQPDYLRSETNHFFSHFYVHSIKREPPATEENTLVCTSLVKGTYLKNDYIVIESGFHTLSLFTLLLFFELLLESGHSKRSEFLFNLYVCVCVSVEYVRFS